MRVVYKHSSNIWMLHYAIIIENITVRKFEVVGLCVQFKLRVVISGLQKGSDDDDNDNIHNIHSSL